MDKRGNIRVINDKNHATNFIIYNNNTIKEFISLNSMDEEPNEYMHIISSKEKLPFFGERMNGWEIETNEWNNYLYPCQILNGRTEYYWFTVAEQV